MNSRRRSLLAVLAVAALGTPALASAQAAPPLPPKPVGAKRHFFAEISSANNTAYTPSSAVGKADFELDLDTLTLRWVLTYQDLSSPATAVALHAPAQPGATGAAIADMATAGLASPVKGQVVLSDAQVEYLLTGWSYVMVSSRKYPRGEARGQLDRVRQAPAVFQ